MLLLPAQLEATDANFRVACPPLRLGMLRATFRGSGYLMGSTGIQPLGHLQDIQVGCAHLTEVRFQAVSIRCPVSGSLHRTCPAPTPHQLRLGYSSAVF